MSYRHEATRVAIELLNDDKTPLVFVVDLLEDVFGLARADATKVVLRAHREGCAVAGEGETAAVERLLAEAQRRIAAAGHPLIITLAPAGRGGPGAPVIADRPGASAADTTAPVGSLWRSVGRLLRLGLRVLSFRQIKRGDLDCIGPEPVVLALLAAAAEMLRGWLTAFAIVPPQAWGLTAFVSVTALMAAGLTLVRGRRASFSVAGALSVMLAASFWLEIVTALAVLAREAWLVYLAPSEGAYARVESLTHFVPFLWWITAAVTLGAGAMRPRWARGALGFVAVGLLAVMLLPVMPIVDTYDSTPSRGLLSYAIDAMRPKSPPRAAAEVHRIDVEAAYARQPRLVKAALEGLQPSRKDRSEIYFVAAGIYGDQDVFLREARSARDIFDDVMGTSGRSVLLVNNRDTLEQLPLANATNLGAVMDRLAEVIAPEKDVLVLFVTSHGSSRRLSAQFDAFAFNDLTPDRLSQLLGRSQARYRVVVLSACYSGSFIPAIEDSRTLVITAASATRTSFGCDDRREWTFFGDAYFNHAIRQTRSLVAAFDVAKARIVEWETRDKLDPSDPQIAGGAEIREKLADVARALDMKRPIRVETVAKPAATKPQDAAGTASAGQSVR